MFLVRLEFFYQSPLFTMISLLLFLQNRFSFLSFISLQVLLINFPFNTYFFKNDFTTIPFPWHQLLKPGITQIPWEIVANSTAMKGFQHQGHTFSHKNKQENLFPVMLKRTVWRTRLKTGIIETISVSPPLFIPCTHVGM